jgi:hypothetical protein
MTEPEPHTVSHAQLNMMMLNHEFEPMFGLKDTHKFPWENASDFGEIVEIMNSLHLDRLTFGMLWNVNKSKVGCTSLVMYRKKDGKNESLLMEGVGGDSVNELFSTPGFELDIIFYLNVQRSSSVLPNAGFGSKQAEERDLRSKYTAQS